MFFDRVSYDDSLVEVEEEPPSGIDLNEDETKYFNELKENYIFKTTKYYLDRFKNHNQIRKTFVPSIEETIISEDEEVDPLHEDSQSPTKCIVHRYPDRVLFVLTLKCFLRCRYCTRSRKVEKQDITKKDWLEAIDYISNHNEIRDVILSGGDPLVLEDKEISFVLQKLRSIDHVEIIRIGTKAPVVNPKRVTKKLCNMIKKFHPVYMNIHFTHPDEITSEVKEACNLLADSGIPLGSQTVLLKGVNDDASVLKKLFTELLKIRVKPYYLYQCDKVAGSKHFRTNVKDGLNIMSELIGWTSGLAIPHYIIDAPGGGGKVPILPRFVEAEMGGKLLIKNYKNNIYEY